MCVCVYGVVHEFATTTTTTTRKNQQDLVIYSERDYYNHHHHHDYNNNNNNNIWQVLKNCPRVFFFLKSIILLGWPPSSSPLSTPPQSNVYRKRNGVVQLLLINCTELNEEIEKEREENKPDQWSLGCFTFFYFFFIVKIFIHSFTMCQNESKEKKKQRFSARMTLRNWIIMWRWWWSPCFFLFTTIHNITYMKICSIKKKVIMITYFGTTETKLTKQHDPSQYT